MEHLRKIWKQSPLLGATCLLMLAAFAAAAAGMALDPRTITGVNAWLKPAKFAISTAIFSATIAWIFGYLTPSPKLTRLGRTLSAMLILEVAIIFVQAWRGTTSHFNLSTPLNGALFGIMGVGIAVVWIATIGVFLAALRQRFADPSWGWSLRLGLLIAVIGSAAGGLMLRPTPGQAVNRQFAGGHTVGAPDGGPGLPGVGWSSEHGDLRVPHFFGLHAIQVLPFCAWLFRRRRRVTALVVTASASYFGFILILTWQALRGESIAQPGGATLTALALWLAVTAGAVVWTQLARGAAKVQSQSLPAGVAL
jgi:hypothetical protein